MLNVLLNITCLLKNKNVSKESQDVSITKKMTAINARNLSILMESDAKFMAALN